MKRSIWGALALTLALAGCNQPAPDGDQTTTTTTTTTEQTAENQAQSRGELANAFVEAARVHAMVAKNDANGATNAVRELRNELATAKANAPLDVQTRINDLDQLAIETQQAIATNTPEALQTSSRLVDQMQVALGGTPADMSPAGGGAGPGSDLTPLTPEQDDTVPGQDGIDRQPGTLDQEPGSMNRPGTGTPPGAGAQPETGEPVNSAP
jgi:uncharacterized lipoprotein NlpE involved in copper resistance